MKSKYLTLKNQKIIKTEYQYKLKPFNKKPNNFGKIYFTKKIPLTKYLLQKKLKLTNNTKKIISPKKSLSYSKKENFPLINFTNIKKDEKKSALILSSNSMDMKAKEPIEKEKIIEQLLLIQDDMEELNQEFNLLNIHMNKLQDNNLSYKTIIEKLLGIEVNENNNDNVENKEINSKNNKTTLKEKKIKLLKIEIDNYDKNIEKQNEILSEGKKEKKIINFININKLINNKNRELEDLIAESNKLQSLHIDMDKKVNFLNYHSKKYKDNIFKLKIKIEMNKKSIKYFEEKIENIQKEIKQSNEKIDILEKELTNIEQNITNKKEQKEKIDKEYQENTELEKEKDQDYDELNKLDLRIIDLKKIVERNENKINSNKKHINNLENKIPTLKEQIYKLIEKEKQNEKNKKILNNYELDIKKIKKEIEKNKNEENERIIKGKKEKEKIQKEIEEFEKAKTGLINKINELNKELQEKTKEQNNKEKELEKVNEEYNKIMKDKLTK